jgi:hypothetical protein
MSDQLPEKTNGRKAVKYRGAKCLNCGTPLDLSDVYCSYCGQLNTTKSLSIKDFFGYDALTIWVSRILTVYFIPKRWK